LIKVFEIAAVVIANSPVTWFRLQ